MPTFQILPTDETSPVAGIIAHDAAHVLNIVAGLACKEADVLRDGKYCLTMRLSDNGLWSIFQRDFIAAPEASGLQHMPCTL